MISENIKTTGELHIVLRDVNGNVKVDKVVPNLVVTTGKNVIASRLSGVTQAVMSHMAVGISSTAPASSNTALGAEIASSRRALATSGGTVLNNEITYTATFAANSGTGAITEAGIFNASISGSMLCRTTFAVVNKDALDTLTIVWKVTIN